MNNPIIQRELIGLLRTFRAFLVMLGLAAGLAALVVLRWPADAQGTQGQAQQVLRLFGYGLLIGLIFLAPIFPATSVVKEKISGTLTLLLNSPLSPFDILFGKLVGVLGYIALLLVMSFPAAAACYAMGGIDLTSQLLVVYGILALVALQYSVLALWISTLASTTDSALRLTYGAILLLLVLPLGPELFLQGQVQTSALGTIVAYGECISPLRPMMEALGQGDIGNQGIKGVESRAVIYALLAGGSILLFSCLILRRLHARLFDRPRAAGKITDEQTANVRFFRRIMFLWFFDPKRRSSSIGPFTNPVMVKEFRCGRFSRSHWMMRLIATCFVLSLGLMLVTTTFSINWGVETLGGMMVFLQAPLIVLLTPSLAAGLISVERESGGWQLLQMTPLSASMILRGKLLSVARTLVLVLLATLPGYAIMLLIDPEQLHSVLRVLITLVLMSVFAMLLSAAFSSIFKRTASATAASYTFILLLCGGTMLVWLGAGSTFTKSTVESVLQVNPIAAALSAIKAPGFADYHLLPNNWYVLGGLSMAALLTLLFRTWQLTRPR